MLIKRQLTGRLMIFVMTPLYHKNANFALQFPPKNSMSLDSHQSYLSSTFSMMSRQVSGKTTGNHGPLLRHKIEAVTIKSSYKRSWGKKNLMKLARYLATISVLKLAAFR